MIKRSVGDHVFDTANVIFMAFVILITVYPLYYVICASFSNNAMLEANMGVLYKPLGFSTGAYKLAFSHPNLLRGYKNTFIVLVVSLPINIVMTIFCAYFMAAKNMMFKKVVVAMIMFTMFFSGGLIPGFLNIRSLGLYNSLWALILPGAISVYNSIIAKTAIEAVPEGLTESAYIDGAHDFTIMFRIIIPLIMPTLAVLILYYGVSHWNSWFSATIYLKEQRLMPLQAVLRSILIENKDLFGAESSGDVEFRYTETIKHAASVISTVPILCIYPFLQKYFVKGVMIGAIKG